MNDLRKKGDFIVDEQTGLTHKIERRGEGMYSNHWLTDFGYVWNERIRPATPKEIENFPNQNVVVQILK